MGADSSAILIITIHQSRPTFRGEDKLQTKKNITAVGETPRDKDHIASVACTGIVYLSQGPMALVGGTRVTGIGTHPCGDLNEQAKRVN